MLTVGLTGGIGSGKTQTASYFAKLGVKIIDSDKIARKIVEPGSRALTEIVNKFGKEVLNDDGSLNRKVLRNIIFNNHEHRQWLEELLHPAIRANMQEKIDKIRDPYCILAIPLLIETLPNPLVNRILVVDAPESLQIQRIMIRDNCSPEEAKKIIACQVSRNLRLKQADDIIRNVDTEAKLEESVSKLHEMYLKLAKNRE